MNGILYGTTEYGGGKPSGGHGLGVVFSLDPKSGDETDEPFKKRGAKYPAAGLIYANGLLYGTTAQGGGPKERGYGTVFSVDPGTGTRSILHAFSGLDGAYPGAAVIDVKGVLYGTTGAGGSAGDGTVFSIDLSSGAETVLYSFQNNGVDGQYASGLVAVKGVLYGTTEEGGSTGDGVVFAIDPKTGTETVLHTFSGADGNLPKAGLTAVNGILYGTTARGGAYDGGTVFSLDPEAGTETVVYSFCKQKKNCPDGANPVASLIDVKGTLYGTTGSGGANQYGTAFSLNPVTGAETVLYSFCSQVDCTDGWVPSGALLNLNGTLYGTTGYSGFTKCQNLHDEYCGGVVFSLKP
ncbi:MAG TPA: choice-of-anchor tandem repeat GloVer-containing protein [Rhizomicrobium sp.]|nr:choice-of-anchor tandem repeat GloVer-containing protein [Rhizomicrobium sp.]